MFPSKLYLIADQHACQERSLLTCVEHALNAGVRLLQYREKEIPGVSRLSIAKKIKTLCEKFQCTLIINDDIELAVKVGADGVHLGQEDSSVENARIQLGVKAIIGVTVRNVTQALEAQKGGADYIGLGPIYKSPTKQPVHPLGCKIIHKVQDQVKFPIFAIGGISLENVEEVMNAGASGIAVISGILSYPKIGERVHLFLKLLQESAKEINL
ncbi:MAG TPA: thiamine phosphate synthase [Nitrospiria bacterium]|jgi:thiamine-phosphate diphosphorylase